MKIAARLKSLERNPAEVRACSACAVCGGPMDLSKRSDRPLNIGFGVTGPDHCPGCGRQRVYRITIDHPRNSPRPSSSISPAVRGGTR